MPNVCVCASGHKSMCDALVAHGDKSMCDVCVVVHGAHTMRCVFYRCVLVILVHVLVRVLVWGLMVLVLVRVLSKLVKHDVCF